MGGDGNKIMANEIVAIQIEFSQGSHVVDNARDTPCEMPDSFPCRVRNGVQGNVYDYFRWKR